MLADFHFRRSRRSLAQWIGLSSIGTLKVASAQRQYSFWSNYSDHLHVLMLRHVHVAVRELPGLGALRRGHQVVVAEDRRAHQ